MKRRKHTNLKIITIVIIIILIWFLFASKYSILNITKNELKIAKKRNHIENYKQKKEKLTIEKNKLEKADKKTIEKKARGLGMAKPGETIIRIREGKGKKSKGE